MRISAPLLTILGTIAGVIAAVLAYQATATTASPATVPRSDTSANPAPVGATSWLPCEHGWKVRGNACVRVKHHVVVVRDLPAPAVQTYAPAVAASSPAIVASSTAAGVARAPAHHEHEPGDAARAPTTGHASVVGDN